MTFLEINVFTSCWLAGDVLRFAEAQFVPTHFPVVGMDVGGTWDTRTLGGKGKTMDCNQSKNPLSGRGG